jgi:hypothetical protein
MYFPWPPLEAGLLILAFFLPLFMRARKLLFLIYMLPVIR